MKNNVQSGVCVAKVSSSPPTRPAHLAGGDNQCTVGGSRPFLFVCLFLFVC